MLASRVASLGSPTASVQRRASLYVSVQIRAPDAEEARSQTQHNAALELPRRKADLWLARAGGSGQLLLTP